MSPSSGYCSKPHRFIAGHLGIISTTIPTTFLVIICLAAVVILLNSSCRPTPTPHTPPPTIPTATSTPVVSPSPSNTPTLPPTLTSTLLPPVMLVNPEDDACIECGAELTLGWSYFRDLLTDEYYWLRVWEKGQEPSNHYAKERYFDPPTLLIGEYNWAVSIVRSIGPNAYEQASEESTWRHFHVLPPLPVVSGISPTSMVEGAGGQVVVSGQNFTTPITLTIDVPLQIIDVVPDAITATVPATLEVGTHSVVVQDSNGRVVSSAVSFTVKRLTTPPPVAQLWNLQTPVPPAPPGYNPSLACVVTPCAPAPKLDEPQNGAVFMASDVVDFKWTWDYCLFDLPGWKFTVRLSSDSPPRSYQYIEVPWVSCQRGKSIAHYQIKIDPQECDRFTTIPGTYYWNTAVVRSVEGGRWERLSTVSETRSFTVQQRTIERP